MGISKKSENGRAQTRSTLSPARRRALRILELAATDRRSERAPSPMFEGHLLTTFGSGGMMPRDFAEVMWPDAEGWHRHVRCGPYGSHKGGGMYLAAGGFLGKLVHEGLVSPYWKRGSVRFYVITQLGRERLAEPED